MAIDTKCLLHINQGNSSNTPPWIDETGKSVTTAYGASYITLSSTHAALTGSTYSLGLTPATNNAGAIAIANHSDFALGSSDFTIEFWYRPTLLSALRALCSKSAASGVPPFLIYQSASALYFQYSTNGSGAAGTISAAAALTINTWHHIAVVRYGTTITMYVNGVSVGTPLTDVTGSLFTNTAPVRIGGGKSQTDMAGAYGQIDEFRISGVARYTAGFSVPTAEFVLESGSVTISATTAIVGSSTFAANAAIAASYPATAEITGASATGFKSWTKSTMRSALLLHMDGAEGAHAFSDDMGHVLPQEFLNFWSTTATPSPKFGGASAKGSTSPIAVAYSEDLSLVHTDFTVEMWIYRGSDLAQGTLFCQGVVINYRPAIILEVLGNGTAAIIRAQYAHDAASTLGIQTPGELLTLNTWHHVALCRSDGVLSIYVDGVRQAQTTIYGDLNYFNSVLMIGGDDRPAVFSGNIDEFRLTTGVSRYTNGATITVPTEAFTLDGPFLSKFSIASGSATGFSGGKLVSTSVSAAISAASVTAFKARPASAYSVSAGSSLSYAGRAVTVQSATFSISGASGTGFASAGNMATTASWAIVGRSTVSARVQFNSPAKFTALSISSASFVGRRNILCPAAASIASGSEAQYKGMGLAQSRFALASGSQFSGRGQGRAQVAFSIQSDSSTNLKSRKVNGGGYSISGASFWQARSAFDFVVAPYNPADRDCFVWTGRRAVSVKTKADSLVVREAP